MTEDVHFLAGQSGHRLDAKQLVICSEDVDCENLNSKSFRFYHLMTCCLEILAKSDETNNMI